MTDCSTFGAGTAGLRVSSFESRGLEWHNVARWLTRNPYGLIHRNGSHNGAEHALGFLPLASFQASSVLKSLSRSHSFSFVIASASTSLGAICPRIGRSFSLSLSTMTFHLPSSCSLSIGVYLLSKSWTFARFINFSLTVSA